MNTVRFKSSLFDLRPGFYLTNNPYEGYDDYFEPFAGCENRCFFCCDAPYRSGPRRGSRIRINRNAEDNRRIMMCYGEPARLPGLQRKVGSLRRRYDVVTILTNGRRLKDARFARSLVEAGVNEVFVSLHGPSAEVNDRITRSPGAFAEGVRGLKNLLRLSKAGGLSVRVGVCCILTKPNLPHLEGLLRFLVTMGVDCVNLATLVPLGWGRAVYRGEMTRYSEIVEIFDALRLRCRGDRSLSRLRVFLVHVPLCLKALAGFGGSLLLSKKSGEYMRLEFKGAERLCRRCGMSDFCEGISSAYALSFGTDEF